MLIMLAFLIRKGIITLDINFHSFPLWIEVF
jgi:hypothetical protein